MNHRLVTEEGTIKKMPPAKPCPYCEYTCTGTTRLTAHIFNCHKDQLFLELRTKYSDYAMPIAPFTIPVSKYNKEFIICLCCNEIWTSRAPYEKHIVKSNGACVPANQLIALQLATGLKFSDKAKEQTATNAIQRQQADIIDKQNARIAKLESLMETANTNIKNLQSKVYITGCCKCAGGQSLPPKIVSPAAPPQPTPKPAPAPIVKKPLINQIVSDSEESLTTDEDIDAYYNNTKLCVNAATCKDNQRDRRDYLMDCIACKNPVCQNCYRKFNSTKINPICSDACRKNARSPK